MTKEQQKNHEIAGPAESAAVKGRIVAAGIRLGALAETAGIAQSTLSQYIAGGRKNYQTQLQIYEAFCRLSDREPTRSGERRFWGPLLNRAA